MSSDRFWDRLQGQEEETELFPAVLPSWTVRYTGWLIVGLFIVGLAGSLVIPVPEVVQPVIMSVSTPAAVSVELSEVPKKALA